MSDEQPELSEENIIQFLDPTLPPGQLEADVTSFVAHLDDERDAADRLRTNSTSYSNLISIFTQAKAAGGGHAYKFAHGFAKMLSARRSHYTTTILPYYTAAPSSDRNTVVTKYLNINNLLESKCREAVSVHNSAHPDSQLDADRLLKLYALPSATGQPVDTSTSAAQAPSVSSTNVMQPVFTPAASGFHDTSCQCEDCRAIFRQMAR